MLGTALLPAPNHSCVLNGCYCLQPHSSRALKIKSLESAEESVFLRAAVLRDAQGKQGWIRLFQGSLVVGREGLRWSAWRAQNPR